ncbi:MAG: hypothetical protein QXL57_01670 [Candidatus Bathyarchaeia archaeon]
MVNKKYATVLFGVFMSLGMSFSQSLVISIINLRGFYFEKWLLIRHRLCWGSSDVFSYNSNSAENREKLTTD